MTGTEGRKALPHHPVLYQESIHVIRPQRDQKYVDGTLGAGGHAWGILKESSPDGLLLGLDVDPQALALAKERLAEFGARATLFQASHTTLRQQLDQVEWSLVDGIVLDLGASSMQFDTPDRGFSFLQDGPLDMRFDPNNPMTAADLVNTWDERSLADILFTYGEERRSRQVAKAICLARPFKSTRQLAQLVEQVVGRTPGSKLHPATRTFQALRIAVNQELVAIEKTIPQAVDALAPGGRLAVITFHSLEDRIVKNMFRSYSQDLRDETHPMAPVLRPAVTRLVQRKPILPTEEEIEQNPRSRSAKLRVIEKLA
jgi:16S rRNA (cytosine1402-N4)-methyltransferase